jgi:hypothetical protein
MSHRAGLTHEPCPVPWIGVCDECLYVLVESPNAVRRQKIEPFNVLDRVLQYRKGIPLKSTYSNRQTTNNPVVAACPVIINCTERRSGKCCVEVFHFLLENYVDGPFPRAAPGLSIMNCIVVHQMPDSLTGPHNF